MATGNSRIILILLALTSVAWGQALSDLRDIQARQPPSFVAKNLGAAVTVQGVVTTRAINIGEYSHLPIQASDGNALIIERERGRLDSFAPGHVVRATGRITQRAGMPVLSDADMATIGQEPAPKPVPLRLDDVTRFDALGKYVVVETFIIAAGQNSGGDVLAVGAGRNGASALVFFPRHQRWNGIGITSFAPGDKIRVTGIASQYCPFEPYDRGFQIVVDDPSQIELLERSWVIPPTLVLYLLTAMIVAFGIWWLRERRMAEQRRAVRAMMGLSEEVLSSNSVSEIGRKVQNVLPPLLSAWNVELFLVNKVRSTLDRIPNDLAPEPISISYQQPKGAFASAVSLCFRNRTLLNIPDFRKSPIVEIVTPEADLPAAAIFAPMFARGEILGVMAVVFRARLESPRGQHAALQHVANQIAASLKLQEQQSIREQLLRTEKMAAAGQLISGVAHDLREPLKSIRSSATRVAATQEDLGTTSALAKIAAEADRGLQIVNHLLAFARMERAEARSVNLHELVSTVVESREAEWRRKGISLHNALPIVPVEVFVEESEIEQVFLSLLIHIEHAIQNHPGKELRLASRVLGSRVQVSIDFSGAGFLNDTADQHTTEDSFSLPVCQAIIQSHGGDIRLYQTPYKAVRYELELPVYHPPTPTEVPAEPVRRPSRVVTAILVEPDAGVRRRLLAMLSARGHRAIPVDTADEATDLVQRMPFDIVFCTMRLPGLNWMEFYRRIRRKVAAFVLLTESYDPDAAGALKDGTGFVLHKPLEESELENILAEVESRSGVRR